MSVESLSARFARLTAERRQTWPAERIAANERQRRLLREADDPRARPAPGNRLAPFELIDAAGAQVSSSTLLAHGPLALVFFRFGDCPACNIALPYYQEALEEALARRGVRLVAVSAQVPVDRELIARHRLAIPVLGDPGYRLSRQLGLTFLPEDRPVVSPGESWIGATLGTQSYEQVKPAVAVIDPHHVIRFLSVSPDWLDRIEAEDVLSGIRGLAPSTTA